jgi:NitT/TauT family transport system permease protein
VTLERVEQAAPAVVPASKRSGTRELLLRLGLPLSVACVCLLVWHFGIVCSRARDPDTAVLPSPWEAVLGLVELAQKGLLLRYTISSLFRVTWAYFLAMLIGIPLGLVMGWFSRVYQALNPLIQVLRPISPIAWIPLAIMWFGITETTPVFLIFLASLFPIAVHATAAVQSIQTVYVRAAQNFGLGRLEILRRVILPATLPQILTGLRIALGIAWLVVVAAEMIVVNPKSGGLGFLIIDARSQGGRYDLVVAGMVLIGLIGLVLDWLVRQLERFDEVRWGTSSLHTDSWTIWWFWMQG